MYTWNLARIAVNITRFKRDGKVRNARFVSRHIISRTDYIRKISAIPGGIPFWRIYPDSPVC